MTRYVNRKYGLIIGSDNVFFFRDANDELSDTWRAIVWAKSYEYNDFTRFVPFLKTLAQQVIWEMNSEYEVNMHYYLGAWLNKTLGKRGVEWDVRPKPAGADDVIFFRTRRNAEKFASRVEELVKGIKVSKFL